MQIEDDVVLSASRRIARLIRRRAGACSLSRFGYLKRLCRSEFGIAVRTAPLPLDFYGQVKGDQDDADNATIIVNTAHPESTQVRVLIHELAECLAQRGVCGIEEPTAYPAAAVLCTSAELRHRVALAVEAELEPELAGSSNRSSWATSELLRLFPLDPKYCRPRAEIERVMHDVVM